MTIIQVPARTPTKIISRFSNSISKDYHFTADNMSSDQPPAGTIEVKGSNWIFPKPTATQPLRKDNCVSKSMWDTFYSVYVTPEQDVKITLENGQINNKWLVVGIVVGILAAAAAFMIAGSN